MKFFHVAITILALLLLPFWGGAQLLQMEKMGAQDGLFSSRFFKTYRDRQGYLWIIGINGVSRYDGSHFVNFTEHTDTSNQFIRGARFYDIIQDKEGKIWIGGDSGLHKYDSDQNTFQHVDPKRIKNVTFLHLIADTTLWVSCGNRRNFRVNIKNGNIQKTDENSEITAIVWDDSGAEWRSTFGGLIIYDNQDTVLSLKTGINDLCFTPQGNLCIGSQNGLYILLQHEFAQEKKSLLHITDQDKTYSLTNNAVLSLEYANGCLWVGTRRGLNRVFFDDEGEVKDIVQIFNMPDKIYSLLNNQINNINVDHEGIIWLATHGGLNKIDPLHYWFNNYRHDPANVNSLHDNNIFPIDGDTNGNIWFGSYERGISKLNTSTGQFHWINKSTGTDIKAVRYIFSDSNETWVAADGRLYLAENDDLKQVVIRDGDEKELGGKYISAVVCHPDGSYWMGIGNKLVQAERMHHRALQILKEYELKAFVIRFYVDSYNRIWAGTNGGGLVLFDYEKKDTIFTFDSKSHSVFKTNTFQAINQDTEGNLWIGTIKGLYKVKNDSIFQHSPGNVSFSAFFEKDGLTHDYVTGILPAKNGVLWLSSWKGIMKYDPNNIKLCRFTPFSFSDGLIDEKYNRLGTFLDKKTNTYYFGCVNGVNYFSPDQRSGTKVLPNVLIGKILLNGNPVKIIPENERSGGVIASIRKRGTIDLLHVRFGSSSLLLPEKQVFAWKLEGRDETWIYSRDRELNIQGIQPGDYRLKIRAATKEGKLGAPVFVEIKVDSYTWILVYVVMGLLLFAGAAFALNNRKWKIAEQKKKENKYVYSKLSSDLSVGLADRLEHLMHEQKPYLMKDLTADKLAGMLEITQGELSQLLNDYLKTRFYEYVNKYRIEEFVVLLQTPEAAKITLTALAEQCGFTSKSTFYRAFNNKKGMTPAQYARKIKGK